MPDRPKSTRPPDWTDHGAFRAAFLERFQPADRQVLQKAGSILAVQVISGDVHDEPVVVSEFRAAIEDARMLRDYLAEIHASVEDELPTEAAQHLARKAASWHREASDLAHGMAGSFQEATGKWPEEEVPKASGPVGQLAHAARQVVQDARDRRRLLPESDPLVDGLEEALTALDGATS